MTHKLKDSGKRENFSTGAMRENAPGKGRYKTKGEINDR